MPNKNYLHICTALWNAVRDEVRKFKLKYIYTIIQFHDLTHSEDRINKCPILVCRHSCVYMYESYLDAGLCSAMTSCWGQRVKYPIARVHNDIIMYLH